MAEDSRDPSTSLGMTSEGDGLTPEVMDQMDLALKGEKLCIDYTELPTDKDNNGKRYTGERYLREHPDRAKIVFQLLALNFSFRAIMRKVHIGDIRLVRELSYRINDINKARSMIREIALPGVLMTADKVQELLPDCKNIKDAAIAHGIMRDTFMQVSGLPTAHIEVNHRFDLADHLHKLENKAEEIIKRAKARVVDPPALQEETA